MLNTPYAVILSRRVTLIKMNISNSDFKKKSITGEIRKRMFPMRMTLTTIIF